MQEWWNLTKTWSFKQTIFFKFNFQVTSIQALVKLNKLTEQFKQKLKEKNYF